MADSIPTRPEPKKAKKVSADGVPAILAAPRRKAPANSVADLTASAAVIPPVADVPAAAEAPAAAEPVVATASPAPPPAAEPQAPGIDQVLEAALAPVIHQTIEEGNTAMATTADTVTNTSFIGADKAQAFFGDAAGRAKAAFDKSTRFYEELGDLAKGNVEALVASSRIAAKGVETLGQEAASYGKTSFESATAAFKSMAAVKSPTELFQLQSDYARSSFDAAVAESSKVSEQLVKLMGDVFQPLSTRFAVAAEKVKSATL